MAKLIDDLAPMLVAESANAVTRDDRCMIRRIRRMARLAGGASTQEVAVVRDVETVWRMSDGPAEDRIPIRDAKQQNPSRGQTPHHIFECALSVANVLEHERAIDDVIATLGNRPLVAQVSDDRLVKVADRFHPALECVSIEVDTGTR